MIKGYIVLISGIFYSAVNFLISMYFTDNIYPMLVYYCSVPPTSPLYVVYSYLNWICMLILFISIESAGVTLIYFYSRSINKEREEYLLYQ